MKHKIITAFVLLTLTAIVVIVLCGCATEEYSKNEIIGYVHKQYLRDCAMIAYADIARTNDGAYEEFKEVPLKVIDKLYINGEEFKSNKYTADFTYDVRTGEYLTLVCFGNEFEYNGGVADYYQREIVTNYLGGRYSINNNTSTTEYTIGSDNFRVHMNEDNLQRTSFYKNGKLMDVKLAHKPDFWTSPTDGATYYYYMKLSDFAEILDMNFSVSQSKGEVYLTSR